MTRFSVFALATLMLACTPMVSEPEATEDCADTSGDEVAVLAPQGSPDELSELLAELIAPRICDRVRGSFIGLPGEGGHEGTAAGLDPSVGRWWIRRCDASVEAGRLRVSFGGPGWTWLDRESSGFRVRQYLRFDADAAFAASLHVGYDGAARVATIWLTPAPGVQAQIRPTGLVRAEATGVFSSVLGEVLNLTGESASARAQTQAATEGSEQLRDKLQAGFTVTYQLDSEQVDFMLGELERGQVPERPWPAANAPWVVNERAQVFPGGIDVIGTLSPNEESMWVDLELEDGEGVVVQRLCEADMTRWLDRAMAGSPSQPPGGDPIAELLTAHQPQRVELSPSECRSVFLVTPRQNTQVAAGWRLRVLPRVTPPPLASEGTGVQAESSTAQPSVQAMPSAYHVELRRLSVSLHNAEGGAWDVFGGNPDPYLIVSSITSGRELARTSATDDNRDFQINQPLPAAVNVGELPLRFTVYDDDVGADELIGTVDLEANVLTGAAIDVTMELRSPGARPRQTGSLQIRLTPVSSP